MAAIAKLIYQTFNDLTMEFHKDPRVQHLPLVDNVLPVIGIVVLYVLFVKKWGPQWMNDRKPFNVKPLIRIHNIMQIILNGYAMSVGFKNSYYRDDYSLTCQDVNVTDTSPSTQLLLKATYVYYMTKYLDLFDTVFFVLRKKNNQISFLHVYHHAIMVMAVWLHMKFFFGGHPTMLGILNAMVHVVMYSYYLLSSMDVNIDLLLWKKRITQIQIIQFFYLVFHFSMPMINNWCNLKFNVINAVAVIQNIFMASMFIDFYYKTYIKKNKTTNKKIN